MTAPHKISNPMRKNRTITIIITVVIAGLAYLFVTKRFNASPSIENAASKTIDAATPPDGVDAEATAITLTETLQGGGGVPVSPETKDEAVLTEDEVWKERLLELLRNDTYSDRELGRQLLKIVEDVQAPDQVRAHAMANALNYTEDENYGEDVKPLALRTDLPEVVNDAILEDLINRDRTAILPVAREFAALTQHPLAGAIEAFVKEADEVENP
jgi:hypothetical protein